MILPKVAFSRATPDTNKESKKQIKSTFAVIYCSYYIAQESSDLPMHTQILNGLLMTAAFCFTLLIESVCNVSPFMSTSQRLFTRHNIWAIAQSKLSSQQFWPLFSLPLCLTHSLFPSISIFLSLPLSLFHTFLNTPSLLLLPQTCLRPCRSW
jgi:hypothetical protein